MNVHGDYAAEGYALTIPGTKSSDYGVIGKVDGAAKSGGRRSAGK